MKYCRVQKPMSNSLPAHLHNLNPEQLQAVQHTDGPLLIFAGAGSGKTRVLTRRIANLAAVHRIAPQRILAVTFTNKAAKEMKERVAHLHPTQGGSAFISTFHSMCVRMLRQHAYALDYSAQFAIYDASDSLSLLKKIAKRLRIDPRVFSPKMLAYHIDRAKNEYRFAEDIREDPFLSPQLQEMLAEVYDIYEKELHSANAMDFGNLLCNTVTLFKLEKKILEFYQYHFSHILIDEYQDTNKVQYMLVRMLAAAHSNLCVVGDDDQSIYAFRGASVENILNFKHDFPQAQVITLHQNYRSTKNILHLANTLISKNTLRQTKAMSTENDWGDLPSLYSGSNEDDEARSVVNSIDCLHKQATSLSDIAVFYRTNAQSRAIEEQFVQRGIPYLIFGGHRFYDRKEIKDSLAYLRLLLNTADNEAFLRVINTPPRGLGSTTIQKLQRFSLERQLSLFAGAERLVEEQSNIVGNAQRKRFSQFVTLISSFRKEAEETERMISDPAKECSAGVAGESLARLIRNILEQSNYISHLNSQESVEAQSRLENLDELCTVAYEYASHFQEESGSSFLLGFLDRTSLASNLDQNAKEDSSSCDYKGIVSLMTLHLAKGLEFDTVFLIGLNEGILPHSRSLNTLEELEEERRLCYVGITRAKQKLYLSWTEEQRRMGPLSAFSGMPSRFLSELPQENLEHSNKESAEDLFIDDF